MKIDETKVFLAKYKELEFEKAVLEQALAEQNDECILKRLKILATQIKTLEECFSILNSEELFVVEKHVLLNNTWKTVIELYEETFGQKNAKAERTLKRIQANAIKKIHTLIVKTNTVIYFRQMFGDNFKS